ncbi:MAG: hypothetical protein ACI88A_004872, partial [Paraglaciecola sp.]
AKVVWMIPFAPNQGLFGIINKPWPASLMLEFP